MTPRIRFLLTLLACTALAQEVPVEEVSGARALETVKTLSDDSFRGRKSGLEGGHLAEEWMEGQVRALGLAPLPGGGFFHEFKASVTEEGPSAVLALAGGGREPRECKYLTDYVTLLYSGKGVVESDVVFVGYGIHAPSKGRDDYEGIDVTGKVVFAVRGKPEGSLFDEERYIGYKSSTAFARGARGFLIAEGDTAVPGTIQEEYFREELPALWLSRQAADDLLGRGGHETLDAQVKALAKGERRTFAMPGVAVRLEIQARLLKDQPVRNVVGLWPGTGPEYVVLGAHLDHVGVDAAGNVYNGADDNASGSAMLLEVARAVAGSKRRFPRTLLFVWFAGEEQGLLGSWAFVKAPPVPLDSIACMLNTDMVGQGEATLAVGGGEAYPRDEGFLGGFDEPGFSWKPFRSQPNSDHYPFQASGVPAFFMHTQGPHPNYHQPGDDWQNIKPELLETAGRYLRRLAERAATAEAPFCRENRYGEYLWQQSHVLDLFSGRRAPREQGVDLHVRWFDGDFNEIDAELTRREAQPNDETPPLLPGSLPTTPLEDLRPTSLLGLRGDAASTLHRPARRLGVGLFAPWLGATREVSVDDLVELSKSSPLIVCMEGVPGEVDPSGLHAPLLLPAAHAQRHASALRERDIGWVAYRRLSPLDDAASVAQSLMELRDLLGAEQVIVVPGDCADPAWAARAPTLTAELARELLGKGLRPVQLKQLFGGNFVLLLERLKRA